MKTWLKSYTVRALAASVLTDIGLAFGIAASGGSVQWWLVGYAAGKTALLGLARVLLGDQPAR